jgi:hypothetical protein
MVRSSTIADNKTAVRACQGCDSLQKVALCDAPSPQICQYACFVATLPDQDLRCLMAWDLECFVDQYAGYATALPVVSEVRQAAKFDSLCCALQNMPKKLTTGAGGGLLFLCAFSSCQ